MAEAIKKSDIIENDILKGVIIEFEQAQIKIKAFNDELKQTARLSKEGLNNVKFNSVNDINQAKIAILEANNAIKQQVLLDKGAIEVATALAQAKVKQSKAENDLTKQKERSEAITQKMTRSEQMLQSAYSRVNGWLGKLRNEYRDLAIKKELNGKLTDAEITRMTNIEGRMQSYDNALKKVDASMGNHQRNVGNYAMAYNGLGNSVNQLSREMPAFANSVGTGFMAISNNLPIFFDEISKIKQANKELIAQGQPVKSVFSQIGASIFSVGTLLSVGVTLLTVYGAKIVEWASNLSGANKEIEKQRAIRERLNKEQKENNENVGKESANYVGLIQTLKRTNEGSQERRDLIVKINDEYGTTLKNLSDEKLFQDQLNQSVKNYIEFKKQEFLIKINEEKIARNLAEQLKLEKEIKDTQNAKLQAQVKYDLQKKSLGGQDVNDLLLREQTGLTGTTNKLIDQQKQLEILNKHLEDYGLKISDATELKGGLGFTDPKTKDPKEKAEKAISFEKDLTIAIAEEKIKQIELEYFKEQETIKLNDRKQKDSLNSEIKTKEEIAKMDAESLKKYNQFLIDKAILEKEITETTLIELKKLDERFTDEQKKIIDDFNKYEIEENKKKIEAEYQLKLKGLEDQDKIWETNLNNSDSNDKEIEKQTKKNLIHLLKEKIKLNKQYNKDTTDLELELSKLKNKDEINYVKSINEIVKLSADYFIEQSNKKIAQIEKEQSMHEKAYSLYSDLAKNGNIQAKESLALENQLIAEANKKKQTELKKQAQWKMLEAGVSAYAKNAGDPNVKNPVMKTFSDITLLTQLLKSLPSFEVGTEDTGTNGNGIDGRGGFHAILHPNERVLTKEQNQLIGNVSNEDLALTMNKLNSGELVKLKEGATANVGNWQNMALISEIQDLKNIIKNKPDFKIEAGEIIQGAMSIVETKTTKNSVFTNKYMIK